VPFLYGPPKRSLRLGGIIGEVVEPKPTSEAGCSIRCPDCGGYFDIRDLAQVIEHAGPLPSRPGIASAGLLKQTSAARRF
jgi:hypothetical protein